MPGYDQSFYVSEASYVVGSTTHSWSCAAGGAPLSFAFSMGGSPAGERVAANTFPTSQVILDPTGECTLNLADVLPDSMPDLGDIGTLTFTIVINQQESTSNIVLYRMVFQGSNSQQARASAGGIELNFVAESDCTGKNMFEA